MTQEEIEEKEWVRRIQKGETEVFEHLVLRYQKQVFNLLFRYLGDTHEANDVAQDVFVTAYKSLKQFRGDARFSSWLTRIAINQAKNRGLRLLTAKKRTGQPPERQAGAGDRHDLISTVHDVRPGPEAILEKKQAQEQIHAGIQALKPKEKTLILLHDLQGLAYEEMSEILELPLGTVKSRLHRARRSLKKWLSPRLSSGKASS